MSSLFKVQVHFVALGKFYLAVIHYFLTLNWSDSCFFFFLLLLIFFYLCLSLKLKYSTILLWNETCFVLIWRWLPEIEECGLPLWSERWGGFLFLQRAVITVPSELYNIWKSASKSIKHIWFGRGRGDAWHHRNDKRVRSNKVNLSTSFFSEKVKMSSLSLEEEKKKKNPLCSPCF